jgi:hypothetical protein
MHVCTRESRVLGHAGSKQPLNGILPYHVLPGGQDVPALLQTGTDFTLLGLSLVAQYNLSTTPPDDPPSLCVNVPNGPQPVQPVFFFRIPTVPMYRYGRFLATGGQ